MIQTCPISTKRVDSHMVRVISAQVALFSALLLLSGELFFAAILVYDYMVRALHQNFLSPFHIIGTCFLKTFAIEPALTDEAPKRFALFLGLTSSAALFTAYLLNLAILGPVIAVILIICALLETLFDYCIGCKLYYVIDIVKGFFKHARNIK